jgi:hypothetical protein
MTQHGGHSAHGWSANISDMQVERYAPQTRTPETDSTSAGRSSWKDATPPHHMLSACYEKPMASVVNEIEEKTIPM